MNAELKEILKQIYVQLEPGENENRAEEFDSMSDEQVSRFQLEHFGGEIPSVREMRKAGIEVKIKHSRIHKELGLQRVADLFDMGFTGESFAARGGATEAYLKLESGKVFAGYALCSRNDGFSRKTGLRLALESALGIRKPKFHKVVPSVIKESFVEKAAAFLSEDFRSGRSATFTA